MTSLKDTLSVLIKLSRRKGIRVYLHANQKTTRFVQNRKPIRDRNLKLDYGLFLRSTLHNSFFSSLKIGYILHKPSCFFNLRQIRSDPQKFVDLSFMAAYNIKLTGKYIGKYGETWRLGG